MDGGAWQAMVHGVIKSDTTEWLHFHFHQGSPDLNFWCLVLQPDFSWPLAPGQTLWFSGPGPQPVFSSLALVLVYISAVCMLLSNLLNLCATVFPTAAWGFYISTLDIQYLKALLTRDDFAPRVRLAMFGNIFSCHNWLVVAVTGIYWADAKNTDMCLQCTGQPLTT